MNNGPSDYPEQRLRHSSTVTQKRTGSPYFTADGAGWIDAWAKVSANVYVYSAYFDPRLGANATVVRIVGLDHHHAKYDGVFITCPYHPMNDSETPRTVRVTVTGAEVGTSKSIPVHYRTRSPGTHEMDSLSLCVRPFYGGVPKVHDLRHFVAYYSLHGVQRRFLSGGRDRDKQLTMSQALLFHYRGFRGETYARDTSMLVWRELVMNSPLMPKPDFSRGFASKVRDVLWNSIDVVLRLVW
ncbi:hypothetical protein HPB52_017886 [Rhipicephalus sanguineus]|uniref:Uncharacterized protein n=1 Tax=Rhipicephalus sanguineus TaxID=34632 RepID=A0A9D4SXB4_RHISA|nr:hypothetical protein HPB52_017886 [Rhipicephalus sanguineus]